MFRPVTPYSSDMFHDNTIDEGLSSSKTNNEISIPRSIDVQLRNIKYNLFSEKWLDEPDELEHTIQSFPTNGDRFAAAEVSKRSNPALFPKKGFMAQAIAAGWHHKSADQLLALAKSVGPNRIQVIHGTVDRMITFPHGQVLLEELGGEKAGITAHLVEGQGHVIPVEMRTTFNQWIEELVAKGIKLNEENV